MASRPRNIRCSIGQGCQNRRFGVHLLRDIRLQRHISSKSRRWLVWEPSAHIASSLYNLRPRSSNINWHTCPIGSISNNNISDNNKATNELCSNTKTNPLEYTGLSDDYDDSAYLFHQGNTPHIPPGRVVPHELCQNFIPHKLCQNFIHHKLCQNFIHKLCQHFIPHKLCQNEFIKYIADK